MRQANGIREVAESAGHPYLIFSILIVWRSYSVDMAADRGCVETRYLSNGFSTGDQGTGAD